VIYFSLVQGNRNVCYWPLAEVG